MRTIERTGQFKKDYKRESKGRHRQTLSSDLAVLLVQLASDGTLSPNYRDHPLIGD